MTPDVSHKHPHRPMDSIASGLRPSWSEMLLIRLSTSCRRSHSPCQYERHVGAVRPVPRSGVHQEIHEGPRRQTTRTLPNNDADLKRLSPLVDGDACGSYPGSLEDLNRSHFPAPSSPTDTTFLIGTDRTVWTAMCAAFRTNHDADLKRLSPLVDGDACCSHPNCCKDLHRSHIRELVGCDYGGGP